MINLFTVGIDNFSGKTLISTGLAATMQSLGFQTCVYKPIEIGVIEKNGFAQSTDLAFVKNIDPYIKTFATYLLKEKVSPLIAAELENSQIQLALIKKEYEGISKEFDCTILEACGGIMEPIGNNLTNVNLIQQLNVPIVVVMNSQYNSINNTLLTINHASENNLNIRGVIINDFPEKSISQSLKNIPRLVEEYTNTKILGIIKHVDDIKKINPNNLITEILNGIDIESVFNVKITKLEM